MGVATGILVAEFALKALQAMPQIMQGAASLAEGLEKMNAYTVKLQVMIAESRDPLPEEWDQLNADIDALEKRLNAPPT